MYVNVFSQFRSCLKLNIMKKLFLITGLLSFSIPSFSQSQNWWKSDGTNTGSVSTFVGTSNNFALKFKSNNIEWFSISPSGIYKFNSLNGSTNGILGVNSSGELFRTSLTGNANDVLRGDGTFGSISSLSGWFFDGNVIFSDGSKNIGIGTNIAPEKLSVNGNILANGSISGTSLNVIDIVGAGKEFKILNSLCLKGVDANVPGSRNMICGLNGDLFVQSTNANYNTIINYGNIGKVGIGLIPIEDFHVGVKARFDKDIFTNKIYTNRITSEDSILRFGDSSLLMNLNSHTIYSTPNWYYYTTPANQIGQAYVKGVRIGNNGGFAKGSNSIAIGTNVSVGNVTNPATLGNNSITMGLNIGNVIDNSLVIGFNSANSNQSINATLFVGPSTVINESGKVGIGTTYIPPGFVFAVKGNMIVEEVDVRLRSQWPDYVFENGYKPMSLPEVKEYYLLHNHLPGFKSTNEIAEKGSFS